MSVEEGSAPNSGSEGDSTSLGLDPDDLEDPTWDFASFTCLWARISEKDILLCRGGASEGLNKRKHRRFPKRLTLSTKVLHYYSFLEYPYSSLSSAPLINKSTRLLGYAHQATHESQDLSSA